MCMHITTVYSNYRFPISINKTFKVVLQILIMYGRIFVRNEEKHIMIMKN